jgi:hypothetical protein
MVQNIQNYWVFGLRPLPGILKTKEHDISETGCFHPQVRKYTELAHVACLTNPISLPSLDVSPILIPLTNNEVTNSQDHYEVTDFS